MQIYYTGSINKHYQMIKKFRRQRFASVMMLVISLCIHELCQFWGLTLGDLSSTVNFNSSDMPSECHRPGMEIPVGHQVFVHGAEINC